MTYPSPPPPGDNPDSAPWQTASLGPAFPSSAGNHGAQPQGLPPQYGSPATGSPYGYPLTGSPTVGPPGTGYPGAYARVPAPPPPAGSSGGVVKWLVIGCLGCSGLLVLSFIALILLGALSGDGDDPPKSAATTSSSASDDGGESEDPDDDSSSQTTAAEESDPATSTPTEDPAAATPVGLTATTETSTLTIAATERTNSLSDSLWSYESDNEYFVVDIEYTNSSGESHDLWASDFILVGKDGNKYESTTDVALAVEDPIIIEEVNPGLTVSGTLIFEVPPGTEFSELQFDPYFGAAPSVTVPFS